MFNGQKCSMFNDQDVPFFMISVAMFYDQDCQCFITRIVYVYDNGGPSCFVITMAHVLL